MAVHDQFEISFYRATLCCDPVSVCVCLFVCLSVTSRCSTTARLWRYGGTGLCSYRVRGVDISCEQHLTVESYTVIIFQQSYLLLLVFHHPLTLSFHS